MCSHTSNDNTLNYSSDNVINRCVHITEGSSEWRPGMRGGHQMCVDTSAGKIIQKKLKSAG